MEMETNTNAGMPVQAAKTGALELLKNELPQLKALIGLSARDGADLQAMAMQELDFLRLHAMSKPDIQQCIPASVVLAVKSVLKKNLSLDPNAGLVYIKTRNINVGTKQAPEWRKALEIIESANGLISVARQTGRILDIKRPEVKKDASGKVIEVSVEILFPSYGAPRWEKINFDESDFGRWKVASHKDNGRNQKDSDSEKLNYANPNYTSFNGGLDPEFARAKAIRHGLKKLGTNPNETFFKHPENPREIIIKPEAEEHENFATAYEDVSEIPDMPTQDQL